MKNQSANQHIFKKMELTKRDKKAARIIIDKGLQKEYEKTLAGADVIIRDWQAGRLPNREAYGTLYQHVKDRDKLIAWRYDKMGGSQYINIVAVQYYEGLVGDEDIETLSDDAQAILMRWIALRRENES
jgi:hypothetical protein